MVYSMGLFKHKFHAGGTLSRYKARLVANGSSQQLGVDFDEMFSPFVKLATIRTVLSLAVSRQWLIHQLDVKNSFLNGDLSETVYMHQPFDFVNNQYPHHVCHLQRSLYGLKQAPRAWFQRFAAYCPALLQQIISYLNNEFDMTYLGALNYFLGISANRTPIGLFLSHKKYALQLLERAYMVTCNPSRTPVDTESKLGLHLYASSTTSLVGYTGADWAGCPSTPETAWLRNLLRELHSPLSTTTLVYCDNVSAVYMSANPIQHQRMKHIEIDIHFVRDMVTAGQVRVLHVPSHFQYADIFTKGLPSTLFEEFRSSLSVRPPPALTAGAY
ncbi:ribonuclease H-like domain-containing protein [Tanacetum coccineum]